ncbi:TetR/AcrR family transcriptional regulator [Actinoplanes sp. NPDC051494]|uniref:TetR/AcrR family transcriptional regulator n=1 Tax=Actinoplanes sp. NPDC051494 TaxID=3363907 RepID=UPI0037A78B56
MRQSKRSRILEAAMRVIERDGVTAVTFEAVAAEAELTKGGLLYHFPSKEALLDALHEDLVTRWERAMLDDLGKPAADASDAERRAAYIRVAAQASTRAELALMIDAAGRSERNAPWADVVDRWSPTPAEPDDAALDHLVARFAADGMWQNDSMGGAPLDPELRRRLLDRIIALTST